MLLRPRLSLLGLLCREAGAGDPAWQVVVVQTSSGALTPRSSKSGMKRKTAPSK